MGRTDNRFELSFEVETDTGSYRVSDFKPFVLTEPGIQPGMRIDFYAVYPPQPVPKINCLTGSIADVPVVLEHTEVFPGETQWSLRINNSAEYSVLIECELTMEGDFRPEGKNDIYMCVLTIPSLFFPDCGRGSIPLEIIARNGGYRVSNTFETNVFSQKLNLGLSIEDIDTLECNIINEEGTCIPVNPSQNISVRITGNVPKYIKAFDFSYSLGDGNETDTYCKRMRYDSYECMVFITKDELPMPSGSGTTTGFRDLNFSMQIKHINYYKTLSGTTKVTMRGKLIHDFVDAKKALEDSKKSLENARTWKERFEKAAQWVDFFNRCCSLVNLYDQLNKIEWLNKMSNLYGRTLPGIVGNIFRGIASSTGQFLQTVNKFGKTLFLALKTIQDEVLRIFMNAGPGVIGCIGEAAIKAIEKEIANIDDFEGGRINTELDIPDNIFDYLKSFAPCLGKTFWDAIKSGWTGYACMFLAFIVDKTIAPGFVTYICTWLTKLTGPLKYLVTVLLVVANVKILSISVTMAQQAITLGREQINLMLKGQVAVADYMENMQNTFLAMAMAQVNARVHNLLHPDIAADQASLYFISSRTGILNYDDEVCKGDRLTIKYDFEKLNQTENFASRLNIQNFRRPFSRTLVFDSLKGEYGPYSVDSIFTTNPAYNPSSHYTFLLSYTIDGVQQTVDYRLYYRNETCI